MSTSKPFNAINWQALRDAVRRRIDERGLSFREVEGETRVSGSTISRFLMGNPIDSRTLLRLLDWLEMDLVTFLGGRDTRAIRATGNAMDAIEQLVNQDESLSADARRILISIMATAYKHAVAAKARANANGK